MTEDHLRHQISTAPRERWRVVKPNGEPCDFHMEDRERAEDHMIAEAMTGSRPDRESSICAAEEAGYRIERIGSVH